MTPGRWQQVAEAFEAALEFDAEQRRAFLAKLSCDDPELKCEVEALLAEDALQDQSPPSPTGAARLVGRRLGAYRVIRLIGEGGMGVVFEAEQEHPRRAVALKVIRPGFANAEMLRRFEREAQVLARLQHPGIAQIFEAGAADTGFGPQAYFAMEFIHGVPLGEYAASRKLTTHQRLELMAKVCDAVEHAHQRGIIHRDLKPGNILVDEGGQPKVLDFGVARVTDSDMQATRQTDVGQLIGTLSYMSPEQVMADPLELDTRSDVYALGVIMYELLADRLPYELSPQLHQAVRVIREEDHTRLSSINRAYRGDVETIVAKALEKDKGRRYSSAAALGADIRRYLANEPIAARPASTSYQLRKFARRHKALVLAVAAVFAVLVAGVVASTREAVRARRAEQTAQAVNDFLQNDLLAQASASTQASPNTKPDPDLKVRTALDRAAARIEGKFGQQPEVEADIRDTIGQTYMDLGLRSEARRQLERALELQRRLLGPNDRKTLKTISRLGRIAYLDGNYPQSEALYRQALDGQRHVLGSENPDTMSSLNGLAVAYKEEGRFGQAEEMLSQLLEIQRRTLGVDHRSTLTTMHNLGLIYHSQGKYDQAVALYTQAVDGKRRVFGPDHPSTLSSMHNLAHVYELLGKYPAAEALHRQTLAIRRRVLGPEHPDTLDSAGDLAQIYYFRGEYPQAESLLSETLEIQRRVLGPEHPDTLDSVNILANTYTSEGKYAQAEALYNANLQVARRVLGPQHSGTLNFVLDFAAMNQREGKYVAAENLAAEGLKGRRNTLGPEHPRTLTAAADLALVYLSRKKFPEAEALARETFECYRKKPVDWQRFRVESLLGESLAGQKKYAEAEPLLAEGYAGMAARKEQIDVPSRYDLDLTREWLSQLYQALGKPSKSVE